MVLGLLNLVLYALFCIGSVRVCDNLGWLDGKYHVTTWVICVFFYWNWDIYASSAMICSVVWNIVEHLVLFWYLVLNEFGTKSS